MTATVKDLLDAVDLAYGGEDLESLVLYTSDDQGHPVPITGVKTAQQRDEITVNMVVLKR